MDHYLPWWFHAAFPGRLEAETLEWGSVATFCGSFMALPWTWG